jgi:hypothetical protein
MTMKRDLEPLFSIQMEQTGQFVEIEANDLTVLVKRDDDGISVTVQDANYEEITSTWATWGEGDPEAVIVEKEPGPLSSVTERCAFVEAELRKVFKDLQDAGFAPKPEGEDQSIDGGDLVTDMDIVHHRLEKVIARLDAEQLA